MLKTKARTVFTFAMAMAVSLTGMNFTIAQQPFGGNSTQVQDNPIQSTLPSEGPVEIRPSGERFPERQLPTRDDRINTSDQPILLNSKYAGWQGAVTNQGVDGKRIGEQLRGNWIMVDPNGRFTGKINPASGADVANMNVFLMHMGRLVKQTTADQDGQFQFTNVRQGAYALVGWGANGIFAFGVNVLANNPENDGKIANHLNLMAFQNKTTINTDWIQYYASRVSFRVFGRYPTGEGRDDPQALFGVKGLYNYLPQATAPATSLTSHTVTRTADDRIVGRIHQTNSINGRPVDVRTTKVLLLEDDSVVASTTTDNYGTFEFRGVPDGTYGVLAAGVDGVGLIAITVAEPEAITADGEPGAAQDNSVIDFTMVSAETIGWLNHYAREIAYQRGLRAPRPQYANPQQPGFGCQNCGNQPGGCAACQAQYERSQCRSWGLTFDQWVTNGCQCNRSGFGDGYFLRETGKRLRRSIDQVDKFYERAFYPNAGGAGLPANNGRVNGGYGYGGNGGYGYGAAAPAYGVPAAGVPVNMPQIAPGPIAPPIPSNN